MTYRLIAQIPRDYFGGRCPISIVYQPETPKRGGHFDLLLPHHDAITDNLWTVSDGHSLFSEYTSTIHPSMFVPFELILDPSYQDAIRENPDGKHNYILIQFVLFNPIQLCEITI